jgi:hypothetical protein
LPTGNIFDNLPGLTHLKSTAPVDEITLYLSSELVNVTDAIKWWREKQGTYPQLSRMALDYLTIPGMYLFFSFVPILLAHHTATSIDVERLFSRGRLVLSHTRSRLSVASTRSLLCLGSWSLKGLVRDADVASVASLDEIQGKIELDKLGDRLKL